MHIYIRFRQLYVHHVDERFLVKSPDVKHVPTLHDDIIPPYIEEILGTEDNNIRDEEEDVNKNSDAINVISREVAQQMVTSVPNSPEGSQLVPPSSSSMTKELPTAVDNSLPSDFLTPPSTLDRKTKKGVYPSLFSPTPPDSLHLHEEHEGGIRLVDDTDEQPEIGINDNSMNTTQQRIQTLLENLAAMDEREKIMERQKEPIPKKIKVTPEKKTIRVNERKTSKTDKSKIKAYDPRHILCVIFALACLVGYFRFSHVTDVIGERKLKMDDSGNY